MKQQILAVLNPIGDALDAIDEMATTGFLERTSAEVLKLLSVWAWNDGFASLQRAELNTVFGLHPEETRRALDDLATRGLIQLRDAGECYAVEVSTLAVSVAAPGFSASWWRFYRVEMGAENEADGP